MTRRPSVPAAVAVGGMIGATARYAVARALPVDPGHLPWATLGTNLSGSFLLGLVLALLALRLPAHRHARPFLAAGVLGAFTTMSTFLVEAVLLLHDDHPGTAGLYVGVSVAGGLALAAAGLAVGRRLAGPQATPGGAGRAEPR